MPIHIGVSLKVCSWVLQCTTYTAIHDSCIHSSMKNPLKTEARAGLSSTRCIQQLTISLEEKAQVLQWPGRPRRIQLLDVSLPGLSHTASLLRSALNLSLCTLVPSAWNSSLLGRPLLTAHHNSKSPFLSLGPCFPSRHFSTPDLSQSCLFKCLSLGLGAGRVMAFPRALLRPPCRGRDQ